MIEYKHVVSIFVKEFPEYQNLYIEHIEFNEEVLSHVFFDEVLDEDILDLVKRNTEKVRIKKLFDFFEEMATNGDKLVVELVCVTIMARLGDDTEILKNAFSYMGSQCKELSCEIEAFWGREHDFDMK